MIFSAMLTDAFTSEDPGVEIKYKTGGNVYNLRRLNAITKIKNAVIRDLVFADDCALNASSNSNMQLLMDKFSNACDNLGFTISIKTTEVLYQPIQELYNVYEEPAIQVNGQTLKAFEIFTYLDSTLSRDVHIEEEINSRIAKARQYYSIADPVKYGFYNK